MPSLAMPDDHDWAADLKSCGADLAGIRARAATMLVHIGLPRLAAIMQADLTTASTILDANRFLSKLADADPKPLVGPLGVGGGFSLTIITPTTGHAPGLGHGEIIEQAPVTLTMHAAELPEQPDGFVMPPFALTRDLAGPPLREVAYA